jgi:protein-disulfide isomerase
MKRFLPGVIIVIVFFAAVAGGIALFRTNLPSPVAANSTPFTAATPTPTLASPLSSPVMAQPVSENLSVTLEEFGDYQCPPCGLLHPELKSIKADYGKRLNFIFSNFPLSRIHKNAQAAAQAAEAARLQGSFWQMHDTLYERQKDWKDESDPRPIFRKFASQIGLDLKRFDRDVDSPGIKARIDAESKRAESLNIEGTPTILIEGQQLRTELMTAEGIRQGIEVMLQRKAQVSSHP